MARITREMKIYAEREIKRINEEKYSEMRKKQKEHFKPEIKKVEDFAKKIDNMITKFNEENKDNGINFSFNYSNWDKSEFTSHYSIPDPKNWVKPIDLVKFVAELSAGSFEDFDKLLEKYTKE